LRTRADAGYGDAAAKLAGMLAERGDLDEATQVLRAWPEVGNRDAASKVAHVLAMTADLDGALPILRALANVGDGDATSPSGRPACQARRLEELRARADAGDGSAASKLASLLAESGDLGEATQVLQPLAPLWDGELLTRQGRGEEARRLRRFGLNPDGSIARDEGRRDPRSAISASV